MLFFQECLAYQRRMVKSRPNVKLPYSHQKSRNARGPDRGLAKKEKGGFFALPLQCILPTEYSA